jgi:hypothetical protein
MREPVINGTDCCSHGPVGRAAGRFARVDTHSPQGRDYNEIGIVARVEATPSNNL